MSIKETCRLGAPITAESQYFIPLFIKIAESQYFIPLFNRISWLCRQHPTRDEVSNGRCNSGPTDPNQNVRTGPVFKLHAMWEPGQFSLDGCHLDWEASIRFSWWLSYLVLTGWFSVKTGAGFQPMGETCPTLVSTIGSSFWTISES
jgi:hypothetical protein